MIESIKYILTTLFIAASAIFTGYMLSVLFTLNSPWDQVPVAMVSVAAAVITGMMVISFIKEPNHLQKRVSK